jgi:hypothetical protein
MKNPSRLLIYLGVLLVVIFTIYSLVATIQHAGKTAVNIQVVPTNAEITVNGVEYGAGKIHLKPGSYEIVAKYPGFADDRQQIDVDEDATDVILLPEPNSEAAYQLLEENPKIQQQREALGGQAANQKGAAQEQKSPIITLLPYTDITAPFSVDYGPSDYREGDVVLIISNSTPSGRDAALRWIKQQGYDPKDLELVFEDYVNPLTQNTEEISNAD